MEEVKEGGQCQMHLGCRVSSVIVDPESGKVTVSWNRLDDTDARGPCLDGQVVDSEGRAKEGVKYPGSGLTPVDPLCNDQTRELRVCFVWLAFQLSFCSDHGCCWFAIFAPSTSEPVFCLQGIALTSQGARAVAMILTFAW